MRNAHTTPHKEYQSGTKLVLRLPYCNCSLLWYLLWAHHFRARQILRNLQDRSSTKSNLEEILKETLCTIRENLDMNIAFLSQFLGEKRVFQVVDTLDDDPIINVGDGDPLEESYCQRVADGRFPRLINDALDFSPALELPMTKAVPVRAHASIPVRFSDGTLYGTLCFFSTKAGKDFDSRDLTTLQICSRIVANLLERSNIQHQKFDELATMIQLIIDDDLMYPAYQPIYHVRSNKIIGYESLIRFTTEPYRPPNLWFEASGAVGLQMELEMAAIRSALQNFDELPPDCYLSVNVSPETINDPSFINVFKGLSLDRLVLEITEHDIINDYEGFNDDVKQWRDQGVRLAVDDVGAGYSSLRHILEIDPDIIKLDTNINKRDGSRALAKAIVAFADEMNIRVVAEGIETREELKILDELGVNKAQGYLLGKPAPIEHLQRDI